MTTSPPPSDYFGFENLPALQAAHARLVRQQGGSPAPADFLESVEAFVIKAGATGRILEDDDARTSAQTVIDYWVTVLLRGRRTPPETGLAEFGFHVPMASMRDRPVAEYLTDERVAIRKRLRLSAAAAQWNDSGRDRPLLWGGGELEDAAKYPDLTDLEKQFIAESSANEIRVAKLRQRVIYAAIMAACMIIVGLIILFVREQHHAREAQHRLAMSLVERAAVRMGDGDVPGAVAWLAQALREDTNAQDTQAQRADRLRLGAAIAQLPKLDQLFLEEDPLLQTNSAKFSSDGAAVLTVANLRDGSKGTARLYDTISGAKIADFPDAEMKVNDAAFCADGRIVTVSGQPGGDRGRVRFWPRDGGTPTTLQGVDGVVLAAVPSPDGTRVALLREKPASIDIRNVADGQPVTAALTWDGTLKKIAFSADGKLIAASGTVKTLDPKTGEMSQEQVRVWDAATSRELEHGKLTYDLSLNSIAFSPDGQRILTGLGTLGSRRAAAEVRDVQTGRSIFKTDQTRQVVAANFSPDGQRVVTAGHDETARVLDALSGRALLEFKHGSSVMSAAYSPDGRFIASGSRDHTARVWRMATGVLALPPLNHGFTVSSVVFSPDGERLLTTAPDGARSWLLRTGEPFAPVLQLNDPIWKNAISADGQRVVAVSQTGAMGRWNLSGGKPFLAQVPAVNSASAIFFSDDASVALISTKITEATTSRWTARVWHTDQSVAKRQRIEIPAAVSFAKFSPDGTRVLIATGQRGGNAGTAGIFDVESGQLINSLQVNGVATHAVFSRDGRYILTASGISNPASGEARVWDAATGEPRTPPLKHLEEVTYAGFNDTMTRVVTASCDDTAKIWDINLATGAIGTTRLLDEHTADLTHAAFSPDGKYVVTASFDRTAVLWEAATGKRLRVLEHPGAINDARFDSAGRYLVTACADQAVRVWEVPSGDWISLFRHEGEVTRAFFTPDAGSVITLSSYEPAKLLRDAQRSASGNIETPSDTPIPGTMLRARVWRLPELAGSVAEVESFSQLLLSRGVEANRDLVRLDRDGLGKIWDRGRNPIFQTFKADRTPVPRLNDAEESEATGEWFAARWHLDRAIAAEPGDTALLIRRGDASANLRDWERAAGDYEKALGAQPDIGLLKRLARARIELGQFAQAVKWITDALVASPEDRNLYMVRAEALAATGRWDEAAADLTKAIELKPKMPSSYSRLGVIRLKQNRPADYATLTQTAVQLFGNDEGFASTAAWTCVLRPESGVAPADVVTLARLGLTDAPNSFYSLNTLGAALYRAGQWQDAVDTLAKSRSAYMQAASAADLRGDAEAAWLMPRQDGRPTDWLFLAMANHQLGQQSEAKEWLKRAQEAVNSKRIRDPRRTWHRLELELLLDEASKLIGGK